MSCQICLEIYNHSDLKTFICAHTVCEKCLNNNEQHDDLPSKTSINGNLEELDHKRNEIVRFLLISIKK